MRRTLLGLARACHPLPSVAVTAFGVLLGVAAGAGPGRAALLGAALLTGQLSIGWANDAVDSRRDTEAGRTEKPVVAGLVSAAVLERAALAAVLVCVPLSLAVGVVPGVLHLVAVAGGWAYDLHVKGTVLSPLPYALSFGLLPVIAAGATGQDVPWLLAVVAALLGVAAHLANTLADVEVDARTGVRGLPQRLGPGRTRHLSAAAVVLACVLLLVDAGTTMPAVAVVLLGAAAALGVLGAVAGGRSAFRVVLSAAGVAVVAVLVSGTVLLR